MAKSANAYVKIIVSSNVKQAMSEFSQAHPKLAKFGGAIKKIGVVGGLAIGALIASFFALKRALQDCLSAYEKHMVQLVQMRRVTGLSMRATSRLSGAMRLSGVDAGKAATGIGFFAKNLDAARQGTAAYSNVFARLRVDLRDGAGGFRSLEEVLADTRARFSEMKDPAERTALAIKLFGRGGRDLLPWLTQSADKIREFAQYIKDVGLEMSERSLKAFSKYRENQRKMSLAWEAIKVNAAAALVPVIDWMMPYLIELVKRASGWLGRFRDLAEKKGLGKALEEMVPPLKVIGDKLRDARRWWNRNRESIDEVAAAIGAVLGKLAELAGWLHKHKDAINAAFGWMFKSVNTGVYALKTAYDYAVKLKNALKGSGNFSGGGGHGRGGGGGGAGMATGGIASGPMSGYKATLHGTELVVPLNGNPFKPKFTDFGEGACDTVVNVYLDGALIEKHVSRRQEQKLIRARRTWAWST